MMNLNHFLSEISVVSDLFSTEEEEEEEEEEEASDEFSLKIYFLLFL